jgi:hypothetical protein
MRFFGILGKGKRDSIERVAFNFWERPLPLHTCEWFLKSATTIIFILLTILSYSLETLGELYFFRVLEHVALFGLCVIFKPLFFLSICFQFYYILPYIFFCVSENLNYLFFIHHSNSLTFFWQLLFVFLFSST